MGALDEHARAGIAAVNEQRFDDAIREFETALSLDASRPDLTNALGMAHLHRGDVGNAIPLLSRAVELAEPFDAPEHQDMKRHFHMGLASAHQLLDQVGQARSVLEGVIERWPEADEPRLQLAQLLLSSCQVDDGLRVYRDALDVLDDERKEAAEVVIGAVTGFSTSEEKADIFLRAHQAEYCGYFDSVVEEQVREGWFAEAARMGRGSDGELTPIVADGARSYALTRVDLVNPEDNTVASVYSEKEPMFVGVEGVEPLAQIPVLLPWNEWEFDVWVCTQCPWHWLAITVQFEEAGSEDELNARLDERVGSWYLAGWNGEFGDKDKGRFHYVTDPEPVGDRALSYVVDLGRAGFDAIPALMRKLTVLHDTHPIRRVLFGQGRIPD